MKFHALVLALAVSSTFAQYSATTLTRKVAPQPQRAPAPVGTAPVGGARPAVAVDPTKVAAEQAKKERDLLAYQQTRAEAGSDNAQYELALRYLNGNGVVQDEKVGREWLEKSAKSGNVAAKKKIEELDAAAKKAAALSVKK